MEIETLIVLGMFLTLVLFSIFKPANQNELNEWLEDFYK